METLSRGETGNYYIKETSKVKLPENLQEKNDNILYYLYDKSGINNLSNFSYMRMYSVGSK